MRIAMLVGVLASTWAVTALGQGHDNQPKASPDGESRRTKAELSPSMEDIARMVQRHVLSSNPKLNRETKLRLEEIQVKGLRERMKLRAFIAHAYLTNPRDEFNRFFYVCHDGKVEVLQGGGVFTSGVVHKGKFYYTCDLGSGVYASCIYRMEIVGGNLKTVKSKIVSHNSGCLKVSVNSQGAIQVRVGTLQKEFGVLDERDPRLLKIVEPGKGDDSKKKKE
jgi:hypothetical protein